MAAPTGVTILATMVIIELSDSVNSLSNVNDGSAFGTIVLRGVTAVTYADGDMVLAKECNFFQSDSTRYAITIEDNILAQYTTPP